MPQLSVLHVYGDMPQTSQLAKPVVHGAQLAQQQHAQTAHQDILLLQTVHASQMPIAHQRAQISLFQDWFPCQWSSIISSEGID